MVGRKTTAQHRIAKSQGLTLKLVHQQSSSSGLGLDFSY